MTYEPALTPRLRLTYLAALMATRATAGSLEITALDQDGAGVPDVAIYAEPLAGSAMHHIRSTDDSPTAIMDQIGSAFVPHILVIEAGTAVQFPNSDTVSHHVYSFSETQRFELDLYRGSPHPPQRFDQAGLIVLGCNIHDGMIGFILVVDTPYFGKTGPDGTLTLNGLPPGVYRVNLWTPRASQRNLPEPRELALETDVRGRLEFLFTSKLQPPYSNGAGSLEWARY